MSRQTSPLGNTLIGDLMTILFDTGHRVATTCLDWLRWKVGPPLILLACLLGPTTPAQAGNIRSDMTTIVGDTCGLWSSVGGFTINRAAADAVSTLGLAKWSDGSGSVSRVETYDTSDDWIDDPSNVGFLSWCYEPFEQKSKTFNVVSHVGTEATAGNGLLVVYRLHVENTEVPGSFTQETLVVNELSQFGLGMQTITMQPGECLSIKRSSLIAVTIQPTSYYIALEEIECERERHASPGPRP